MKISDFRIPTLPRLSSSKAHFRTLHRIVFPPKCLVCGCFYHPPEAAWTAAVEDERPNTPALSSLQRQLDRLLSDCLCQTCIRGLAAVESPICDCCGIPIKGRQGSDHRCGECILKPKQFRIARAPLIYDPVLLRTIHRFKYQGKIQLAHPLSEFLLTVCGLFWEKDSIDLVLPVPLHPKKFKKRGFNQAYLLVRDWNQRAGRDSRHAARWQIKRNLLLRVAETAPQSALGRAKRAENVKNAFDLNDPDAVIDQRILLVDDVYTTGATVNECARRLLDCGARQVDVLTLARAV